MHECAVFGACTNFKIPGVKNSAGDDAGVCTEDCFGRVAPVQPPVQLPTVRRSGKFCYYTASTTANGPAMVKTMVESARRAGVTDDFHAFTVGEVEGAINHSIDVSRKWKHMRKLEILREELAHLGYDYCVWLDSDTYFVRHPGDLLPLIRSNPFWIQGESELTHAKVRRGDWWGCPIERLKQEYRRFGITQDRLWTTNGGMFILRTEAIPQVVDKAFEIYDYFVKNVHKSTEDETPLALCSHLFVNDDPVLNQTDATCWTWGCDWAGRFKTILPDGQPWTVEDWLTGKTRTANPAIVHAMRAKHLMAPKPLTTIQKAMSLAKTMAGTAVQGLADDKVIESRMAICQKCDHFTGTNCKLCSCQINSGRHLANKLANPTSECPAGKWGRVQVE